MALIFNCLLSPLLDFSFRVVQQMIKISEAEESSYYPASQDFFKEIEDSKGIVNEVYVLSVFICLRYKIWQCPICHSDFAPSSSSHV